MEPTPYSLRCASAFGCGSCPALGEKEVVMNPVLYDVLLVALSALLSWFITHRYYRKSMENQDKENAQERAALIEALKEKNAADSTLLT